MKIYRTLIILGVFVFLFPLLHLPNTWEVVLHGLLGLLIIIASIKVYQDEIKQRHELADWRSHHASSPKDTNLSMGENSYSVTHVSVSPEKVKKVSVDGVRIPVRSVEPIPSQQEDIERREEKEIIL